jgi:hypothetical protein
MASAVATPDLYADLRLTEAVALTAETRADRERGVIHNVRVLGQHSDNGRVYTAECMKDAVARKLYEGAAVYPNHRRGARGVEEVCGRLRGVYFAEGTEGPELRARRFVLKRSHTMYEQLMEAAADLDRNDFMGLSHEAEPESTSRRGDTLVVHKLKRVEGVAVVHDPATTNGLHEGRTAMATKLREWVDSQACNQALTRDHRKRLLFLSESLPSVLAEQELDMPDAPPPADTGEGDPMTMLAKAAALLASSGDADQHDLGMKILKLLKPDAPEAPAETSEGEDDDDKKDKPYESRQRGAGPVLTEAAARGLCEGMDCKPALAAVIAGMPIDKALTVLKESKAAAPPAPRVRGQEAGAGPKRLAEGKATVPQTDDPKELGAYLRGKD